MMIVWYGQINFFDDESTWQFKYGIGAASGALALSLLYLRYTKSSEALGWIFVSMS